MNYNSKDALKYSVGKTLNGQLFKIPETFDMVRSLFDPTLKKSLSDVAIVISLVFNLIIFYHFPEKTWIYVLLYVFWRLSYNIGIGFLLYNQSNYQFLFRWFDKHANNFLVQKELKARLSKKDLEEVPIEFKTWIIFRSWVNLILMNDFTSYMLLVLSCSSNAIDPSHPKVTAVRWILGISFFIFNIIVKLDAHKIVKDYAWYWGDFFFRLHNNEELIFDGVFDLAPHPMYSIGYAGYYGLALLTQSYTVLFSSIFGHLLQFVFLKAVEDPHIEKIYGVESNEEIDFIAKRDLEVFKDDQPLLMLNDFNVIRATDWLSVIVIALFIILGSSPALNSDWLFALTLFCSITSNLVINGVLYLQSHFKSFTISSLNRHQSVTSTESLEILLFKNWCILYNNLILLKYSSVFSLAMHYLLHNRLFQNNYWIQLRILVFIILTISQFLVNMSITRSIGKFGWFYGDFFLISEPSRLKYVKNCLSRTGIYRYLNQPERFSSLMTIFGLAILFNSLRFLILAIIWAVSTFVLINFIERQHMIQVYGDTVIRHKSGVSKSINQLFIPKPIQGRIDVVNGSVDKVIDDTSKVVNDFIRRKLSNESASEKYVKLIRSNSSSQITIVKSGTSPLVNEQAILEEEEGEEEEEGSVKFLNIREDLNSMTKFFYIGDEIEIQWKSSAATKTAWIGLYKILSTQKSRLRTLISSKNHWIGLNKAGYDNKFDEQIIEQLDNEGTVKFTKEYLYFDPGVYEFRLYNDESHTVSFISEPFEFRFQNIEIPLEITTEFCDKINEIFEKVSKHKHFKEMLKDDKEVGEFNKVINQSIGFNINLSSLYKCDNISDLCEKIISIKKLIDDIK